MKNARARWLGLLLFVWGSLVAGEQRAWPPEIAVTLAHLPTSVRLYVPEGEVRALVVFGSGDGGWSYWEDEVAGWLQADGVAVAGFDFRAYSKTDYTRDLLARDLATVARAASTRLGHPDLPVLYAGWSMGAVQAVAAAAPGLRPEALRGVLLFSADARGRYGIRSSDEMGLTPKGPGTWGLEAFSADMRDLRVVQFQGTADFLGKTTWIHTLASPQALYLVKGANHGFDGPEESFRPTVLRGVAWALGDEGAAPRASERVENTFTLRLSLVLTGLALLALLISRRFTHVMVPVCVVAVGLTALLQAVAPASEAFVAEMERWFPLELSQHSRFLLALSGVALLLLARGLLRRKRIAWYATLAVLAAACGMHVVRAFAWQHALAATVLILALLRHRAHYHARSDAPSVRLSLTFAALALVVFGGVGTVLLHQAGREGQFGEPLGWRASAETSVLTLFQIRTAWEDQAGRPAATLLESLRLEGLGVSVIVLFGLLRPVVVRSRHRHPRDLPRVEQLVQRFGSDPMSAFALLGDKRFHFARDGEGVVAFSLWRDHAVVLADPICAPEQRPLLVQEFVELCQRCDWKPVFYCSHESMREVYEGLGFQLLRVAEDARLDLRTFKLEGTKFQNLRTARNKARRLGLVFGWYQARVDGPNEALEADLREVSDLWLRRKKGGEMAFDLGRFEVAWLRRHEIGWVRDASGKMLAFATWNAFDGERGRCLDLMRGREEARDVIDFLILESFDRFVAAGVYAISLGNAPLANTAAETERSLRDSAVHFLFQHFDRFYGYKRLFSFKQKYFPDWRPRTVAYPRDTTLPVVGMAIAGVHLVGGFRSLWRS